MTKRLQDMTLQELWELFPIVLVPHNSEWRNWAREEIALLSDILSDYEPNIHHIGSTAVPGIYAKPIVDILVELSPDTGNEGIKQLMEKNGYICMSESVDRLSFNKGYTPEGYDKRVYHIHVHPFGKRDEVVFRDYLIGHHEAALEYERLKLSLLPKYQNNRDGYTEAKTQFIKQILELANTSKSLDP